MGNTKKSITALIIGMLFVGAISGTVFYYNWKIEKLTSQIAELKVQVSNLNSQITNLTSANLVSALGAKDIQYSSFYYLYITGSVNNTGRSIAYNVGLHVLAYGANKVEINTTFPIYPSNGMFGVDIISKSPDPNSGASFVLSPYGNYSNQQFTNLTSGQSYQIIMSVFHNNLLTNWTLTPLWTNIP